MSRLAILLLTAAAVFGADDPWTKVKDLKSGTEIRVVKKGATVPIVGKIYEATDESLVLVVKNEQLAIHKDVVDRVDYRPSQSRITKETTTKEDTSNQSKEPRAGMNGAGVGPGTTTSTSVGFGSKPDFETIYRRPAPAPKK